MRRARFMVATAIVTMVVAPLALLSTGSAGAVSPPPDSSVPDTSAAVDPGSLAGMVYYDLDKDGVRGGGETGVGGAAVILAGWASNSKYPFLGGVRASAQLISYELSMTLSVLPVFLWINAPGREASLSLVRIVEFQSQAGFWGGDVFDTDFMAWK